MTGMECFLWNDGWQFQKLGIDKVLEKKRESDKQILMDELERVSEEKEKFQPVNLPHDWLIYDTDNLYEDSVGWYYKSFTCDKKGDRCYELFFEGVYMDCAIFLNGQWIGEWKYGYSSFSFDVTDMLAEGDNEVFVRVCFQSPNSRWYSGAGVYRNVYLIEQSKTHFVTDGLYISSRQAGVQWRVNASAELANLTEEAEYLTVKITAADNQIIAEKAMHLSEIIQTEQTEDSNVSVINISLDVSEPVLWSIENPYLYRCELELHTGDDICRIEERIGFKTVEFDVQKGLFLNGKHIKLNGVCEHHDFGAVGAVFNRAAMKRKLDILRKMGVNSIRSTHNMPAIGFMELCDEMGFLVVSEAFDMWERSKTEYDYARFFADWWQKDVRSWVRRDRNHVSLLLWSIGNEIYDTHVSERGQEITRMLAKETRKHDSAYNAPITIGSNFMPWENARRCADIVKYAGYNYGEKYYEEHHAEHPDWYMYGSETGSTVQSRGIYHFPYKQSVLADEDEQCSSLGNSTTSWGAKSTEACIITERDHDFSLGQFLWTGFDYIGEPTPYHTRNSYFGQIDTAGFPKDSYYIYKAEWTSADKEAMVHIFPYWDFNPGQIVDVRVASNASVVELFLNGISYGEYRIDHKHGTQLTGNWQLPYEEGELTAVAYDEKHHEIARESRHSFGEPEKLVMELYQPDSSLRAGTYDLAFVTISAVDKNGYRVENANNLIHVEVTGAGWLTGLDNGDSTDGNQYKGKDKRLFSGKLLAIVAVGKEQGTIEIEAASFGMQSEVMTIPVIGGMQKKGVSLLPESFNDKGEAEESSKLWARKIVLTTDKGRVFSQEIKEIRVSAMLLPTEAAKWIKPKDLIWKAVNDAGIESPIAKVERTENGYSAKVTALGDGEFRLRCMVKNGTDKVKVISQLEFKVEGMGEAYLNPYGFIAGGMYTYVEGEAGNGNEHGVSTARDGRTVVGFDRIDFGAFGSDKITLPVFELGGDPCPIEIWEGIPQADGSELLASVVYHKPSIWNVYQEETYKLKRRVTGITQISFVLNQKIHLKGFSFIPVQKAYEKLEVTGNDAIYGDDFTVVTDEIREIGNNVTIEFKDMDFGEEGCKGITICGRAHNDTNTIHISFFDGENEVRQIVEFPASKEKKELDFELKGIIGKRTVRFIFMPGSKFDFSWFRFR